MREKSVIVLLSILLLFQWHTTAHAEEGKGDKSRKGNHEIKG